MHNFVTFIEVLRDRPPGHDWKLEPGVTCGDYPFDMIVESTSAALKRSRATCLAGSCRSTYMLDVWFGFTEINANLLSFWWLWRRSRDGLLDPRVRAGSRTALQRVLRLRKPLRRSKTPSFSESVRRKITEGRPLNCKTGMKSKFYGEDEEQCGVEQLPMQYYVRAGGGWHGVHTESGIWLTIFGLLL
ncbi:hypothetical protein LOK49_LG06G02228 [Camellia lanceoleosa]|uniref:Uncharacterized protein n=1 Tax=Camellia lanceoleosa TaxID=1840588 RepID=A0ACC0H8R3_9ERIC|nr:hypothetical protein LOK49_LG06G02228 [Camellia lanceoleosa]